MDGSEWQRVATRIGLAQLDGSKWQRVATRIGLALLDGREWQRSAPEAAGVCLAPPRWFMLLLHCSTLDLN